MSTDIATLEAMPPAERLAALRPLVIHAGVDPRLSKLYDRTADELAGKSAKTVAREFAHTTPDTLSEVRDAIDKIMAWYNHPDPRFSQKYRDSQGELTALVTKRDELKARPQKPPQKSVIAKAAEVLAPAKSIKADPVPPNWEAYSLQALPPVVPDRPRNEMEVALWSGALGHYHDHAMGDAAVSAIGEFFVETERAFEKALREAKEKGEPEPMPSSGWALAGVQTYLEKRGITLTAPQRDIIAWTYEQAWHEMAQYLSSQRDIESEKKLRAHFGDKYDEVIDRTNKLIAKFMAPELPEQKLRQAFMNRVLSDNTKLGSDPTLIRFLAAVSEELADELDEDESDGE